MSVYILCFVFGWMLISCDKHCEEKLCDQEAIEDAAAFETAPDDHLDIVSLEVQGDCLIIEFGSSGCDGSTWELNLIDSERVLYSNPPQRNLRLSLKNDELCDAYFLRTISFDISGLQVFGGQVFLNITNSGDQILYKY